MPVASRRRQGLLLSVGIALFWGSLYIYYPILAPYAKALGADLAQVGLIVGSYGLTQAILRVPLGLFADWRGVRRPIVVLGCAVSLAGAVGLALARTPWQVFWSRGCTGVAAATWVASSVMLAGYFPPRRAVRATSLAVFLTAAGQVFGTSAGGFWPSGGAGERPSWWRRGWPWWPRWWWLGWRSRRPWRTGNR